MLVVFKKRTEAIVYRLDIIIEISHVCLYLQIKSD